MITYEKFAARVAEAMKRLGLPAEKAPGLDHVFADYRRASLWSRSEVIRGYVESVKLEQHGLPTFREAKANLYVRLRPRTHYDLLRLRGLAPRAARIDLGPDLCAELVYEASRHVVTVDEGQLERWAIGFADGYWAALENLRARGRAAWNRPANGVHACGDATQLALTDVILALPVSGAPVVVAPHRDLLVVTGSEDGDGLALVAQLVRAAVDQPRLLSIAPIAWDGEKWVPFVPPTYHLRHDSIRRLHLAAASRDYREQKGLLQPLHPRHTVVELVVSDGEDGRPRSGCTLREDTLPALAPRTDLVTLVPRDGEARTVRWDRVSPAWSPLGTCPERWEVAQFPRL